MRGTFIVVCDMRKLLAILTIPFLLCACGQSPTHLQQEIEQKSARIVDLERRLGDLVAQEARAKEELRRELAWGKDKLRHEAEEHRRQILVKDRTIGELEREVATLRRELAEKLPLAATPVAEPDVATLPSVSQAEPLLPPPEAEFIDPPSEQNADLFPLLIADVRGVSVVSGTHTVMRKVESSETYKDDLGVVRPHYTWEQGVVTQYTTTVSFTLENLTRSPQRASVRAGAASRDFVLAPGQRQEDISLVAARGSRLLVVVGGRSRSVEVTYGD